MRCDFGMTNNDSQKPIYLFVHLPKCAGTSIIKSLSRVGKRKYIILSDSPESKLQALSDLQAELKRGRQQLDDIDLVMGHDVFHGIHSLAQRPAAYFSFLRDPVTRYVSHYRYLSDCAKNRRSPIHEFAKNKMAPDGRLLSIQESIDRQYFSNVMTNHLAAANDPDLTTKRWKIEDPQRLYELAATFLDSMDFIGFVETISQDTETICQKLGLPSSMRLTNLSKTHLETALDESVIAGIKQLNDLDQPLYEHALLLRKQNKSSDRAIAEP